jgi:glutathione S-transferase
LLSLYEYPNSVCCQKVNLALIEKDLEWKSIILNLAKNEHYSPEYLRINPKAVVPSLIHEGLPVIESTLICEYLDETFPDIGNKLIPESPIERAHMKGWSKAIDEGLHDGVADIGFSAMFRDRMKRMPEDKRQVRFDNIGDPKRHHRAKTTFDNGAGSPFVKYTVYAFEANFEKNSSELADGRE